MWRQRISEKHSYSRMIFVVIITISAFDVSKSKESAILSYAGCLLKDKDWVETDYLLLTWTIKETVLRQHNQTDLEVHVQWSMDENHGHCVHVTMTTCKLYYGEASSPDFNNAFNMTVTIENSGKIIARSRWLINNTFECLQPPRVGHIFASPFNSSCVEVRWSYSREQRCSNLYLFAKTYRLRFRARNRDNSTWPILTERSGRNSSCHGEKIFCRLIPYTVYDVTVQCRITETPGIHGLWSEANSISVQTRESVPSGTPEVTPGGFSYDKKDCNRSFTRNVEVYWKALLEHYKNGIIKGYKIEIYEDIDSAEVMMKAFDVPGEETVAATAELLCSTSYIVSIKAFTAVGSSENSSIIIIPSDNRVLDIQVNMVPEMVGPNKDLQISWVFQENIILNITSFTVLWCRKTLEGRCKSHINWIRLPQTKHHYLLSSTALSLPVHDYIFGFSVHSSNGSSGVLWSRCIYADDKDVLPPRNIRFGDIKEEGALLVQWDSLLCDFVSPVPYILHFIAHLCVLDSDVRDRCSGEERTKEVGGHKNSVLFSHLDTSKYYGVYVVAVTRSNTTSIKSKFVTGKPYIDESALTVLALVMIVLGGLALVVLMVVGASAIFKTLFRPAFTRVSRQEHIADIVEMEKMNGDVPAE